MSKKSLKSDKGGSLNPVKIAEKITNIKRKIADVSVAMPRCTFCGKPSSSGSPCHSCKKIGIK